MNILITKKKQEITTPETVNFTALLAHSDINNLQIQSRFIELLNEEFTEEEQKLYIANLYMYLNYDSTTDYPINLETVYKMIGFANKGNAMKTIKSNFTKDEDYKISLFPTEKRVYGGQNREDVMLNVDTFKSLCMLVKTPEGKKIRKYYVKLENVNNKITKEQIKISVRFLSNEVKSDSLQIVGHKKNCDENNKCITKKIDSNFTEEIKGSIISAARLIKIDEKKKQIK